MAALIGPEKAAPSPLRWAVLGVTAFAFLALPLWIRTGLWQHLAILVLVYAAMSMSWNIVGGYAGQLSFGHAIFFGIGSYVSTFFFIWWGVSPWMSLLLAALLAGTLSVVLGSACFRLHGHYFAIATLVIGEAVRLLFKRWTLVQGAAGASIPMVRDSWAAMQFHSSKLPFYYIFLGLAAGIFLLSWWIERSKTGLCLKAIRCSPAAAESLGVNLLLYKQVALAVSAACTAMVGVVYVQYLMYVSPDSVFHPLISIAFALMPMVGGIGTLYGPLIGGVLFVALSEGSRMLVRGDIVGLHLAIYGLLIILITLFEPRGFMGIIDGWVSQRNYKRQVVHATASGREGR